MNDQCARARLRTSPAFVRFSLTGGAATLHGRFEEQVARRPDATAVVLASGDVSYHALNRDADRAAAVLDERASSAGPVAQLLPQGYDAIVWTLAILKTARPYAPLDQRLPASALRDQLDDLAPSAIVAAPEYAALARSLGGAVPVIDAGTFALDTATSRDLRTGNAGATGSPDATAYVFYTSGSTGRPKGVHDTHRNVLHNVLRYTNTLQLAPDDRLSLVQNPSFSGTVSSLFAALLNGAAVVPFSLEGDGLAELSSGVRRLGVTIFHAVPSIFRTLDEPDTRFPHVRVVRLEGDRASAGDVARFKAHFQPGAVLVNGLGATECGLVRQFFVDHDTPLDAASALPLGYAVPDVDVSIVDEAGGELPAGDIGEIVVRSAFLATGYWNRPDLTAARFKTDTQGRRRYRTGDLGRLRSDGCLEHLGRVDHRVRIAGAFVDTDAVERALQAAPGVAAAVVHDYVDGSSERRLCAYVVRDANANLTPDAVRARCAPFGAHATPSAVVFLDALPLTKDLKVDRGRLPAPGRERPELPNDYVAPTTPVEQQIAEVWSEVLEIFPVGVTDGFVALGGDSLRAARIAARLEPRFGSRIHVTSLFEHPTVRELARAIGSDASPAPQARPDADAEDHRVAIIGMAARFAGAESVDEFWLQLRDSREGVAEARGAIPEVDRFDAALFGLTPYQARCVDPQQRVWVECAYRALEDAGIPVGSAESRAAGANIGVFVGGRESTYLWHLAGGDRRAVDALLARATDEARDLAWGNDRDALAARTSYLLGLTGPSLNVQTACSTSLVAVAEACQSLIDGRCDAAIAGGVAVTIPQPGALRHGPDGMHSSDGHCRPFDAEASGTVFSDGVGAVVLKRLADAVRDGDRIDAVIRGWAVTNDGSGKASFAAPAVDGQVRAITRAQAHAGVKPAEIGYVEAHGSATPVGDPIEVAALTRAFRRSTDTRAFCGLGSVKSNIGHADAAAGIAGLIKTVQALRHRVLPPTLHYRAANPALELEASPFFVVDRLQPWPAAARRIAGVSSFGVGGTNCHVIVEEAPAASRDERRDQRGRAPSVLVPLSAATASALEALEARVREFVLEHAQLDLQDLAATAQRRRAHHRCRVVIRCATLQQLAAGLTGGAAPKEEDVQASGGVLRRWQGRAGAQEIAAPPRDASMETIAVHYVRGARVDWESVSPGPATPVRLPSAPFERARHWYDGPLAARHGDAPVESGHPLLGRRLRLPGSAEVRFETRFSQTAPHFLGDHRLFGVSLPPAASHLSMLAEAATVLSGRWRFDALYLLRPLLLPDGHARLVQLILRPSASGFEVELASAAEQGDEAWTTHLLANASAHAGSPERWNLAAIRDASARVVSGADFYSRIWANQGGTGSSFRWIDRIWQGERQALCRAVAPPDVTDASAYALHPGLIEAACQVLHCCGEIETTTTLQSGVTYVPFSVDVFELPCALPSHAEAWCHAQLRELAKGQVVGDLTILTASGDVVAKLTGFRLRPITRDAVATAASSAGRVPSALSGGTSEERAPVPVVHDEVLEAADVIAFLRRRCAELSGYPEAAFADDAGLIERGFDSLSAMRLAWDLQRAYGRTVPAYDLLDCDNLRELAARVVQVDGRQAEA